MTKLRIKLNEVMIKRKLNIQQVADITLVNRDIVSKYKKGYIDRIDVSVLERLGDGLKCKVNDLLEFEESKSIESVK